MYRLNTAIKQIVLCAAFSLPVSNALASGIFEDSVVQVDEVVDGQLVSEYANIWWQWTYSMPPEISPVRDNLGTHCHQGQTGDVWFLAGGYGSSTINRICEVPAGKYLFFPVINMVYWPRYKGAITCDEAKENAALNNDSLLEIRIELDGMESWNPANTRIASSECFDLLGMVPREYEPPYVYPAASDGYWVMLKPLSRGTHSLKFSAQYNNEEGDFGHMAQDIEYQLIVK